MEGVGVTLFLALAGYPIFVNHYPRVQPMHHSVLPEEGGVVSQKHS